MTALLDHISETKQTNGELQDGTANPIMDSGRVSVCIIFRGRAHERLENM